MSNVLPFRRRSPPPVQQRSPLLPDGAIIVTWPLHLDPIKGFHWIKKRNPECSYAMSLAKPTFDDRLVTVRHVAVDGPMSGEEAVMLLMAMPEGSSIGWRKL